MSQKREFRNETAVFEISENNIIDSALILIQKSNITGL